MSLYLKLLEISATGGYFFPFYFIRPACLYPPAYFNFDFAYARIKPMSLSWSCIEISVKAKPTW